VEKYWNVEVKEVSREEILIDNKKIEFDIYIEGLIENYPAIILGEVKSNITIDEVDKFYKKVEIAKTYYNVSDIRVIFFGYRAYREVREYIRSKGGAMLFTNGKTF
ncbi:MAG: hypothetical protein KDK36_08880, partial [Leptospiraceae bacterium]|nr:hypothetical protein [Leptospiraceae bacterium]